MVTMKMMMSLPLVVLTLALSLTESPQQSHSYLNQQLHHFFLGQQMLEQMQKQHAKNLAASQRYMHCASVAVDEHCRTVTGCRSAVVVAAAVLVSVDLVAPSQTTQCLLLAVRHPSLRLSAASGCG